MKYSAKIKLANNKNIKQGEPVYIFIKDDKITLHVRPQFHDMGTWREYGITENNSIIEPDFSNQRKV